MTGGILQLISKGVEDNCLTYRPSITFFSYEYKRHTNFSIYQIKQEFNGTVNFGKKTSCIVSKNGDLISDAMLVLTLPEITKNKTFYHTFNSSEFNIPIYDYNFETKFCWNKFIGHSIIKYIELEIDGIIIDKLYGEWLNIWFQLTENLYNNIGIYKMIGHIPELYNYSLEKDKYTLYIPLYFWFSKVYSNALPIIAIQNLEIRINLELNELNKCYSLLPTNYIELENEFVHFKEFDLLEQKIDNNDIRQGIFSHFDLKTKRMYYKKISKLDFEANNIKYLNTEDENCFSDNYLFHIINDFTNKYNIYTSSSNYWVYPKLGTYTTKSIPYTSIINMSEKLNIVDAYLLISYVNIDISLRNKFVNSKHEYLIEQLQLYELNNIESSDITIDLNFNKAIKCLLWYFQLNTIYDANEVFNYTDNLYINNIQNSKETGQSIFQSGKILINNNELVSDRNKNYYNYLQAYNYFKSNGIEGLNIYSFSIYPTNNILSGFYNLNSINNGIKLCAKLKNNINNNNLCRFKCYTQNYNILKIMNGKIELLM